MQPAHYARALLGLFFLIVRKKVAKMSSNLAIPVGSQAVFLSLSVVLSFTAKYHVGGFCQRDTNHQALLPNY